MTSLYGICGLAPPPIKNPGNAYAWKLKFFCLKSISIEWEAVQNGATQ